MFGKHNFAVVSLFASHMVPNIVFQFIVKPMFDHFIVCRSCFLDTSTATSFELLFLVCFFKNIVRPRPAPKPRSRNNCSGQWTKTAPRQWQISTIEFGFLQRGFSYTSSAKLSQVNLLLGLPCVRFLCSAVPYLFCLVRALQDFM